MHLLAVCMQVREAFGAAHFAQGLRRMAQRLGNQQLSVSQLQMARDLAESLVASLEQVCPACSCCRSHVAWHFSCLVQS